MAAGEDPVLLEELAGLGFSWESCLGRCSNLPKPTSKVACLHYSPCHGVCVECRAVQSSAVQCSEVGYDAVQCSAV